jgi:zinc protease
MSVWEYIQRLALALVVLTGFLVKAGIAMSLPVAEFTLGNGLNVIVIEDHRAPVVLHAVQYKVGAADEAPGKTGLAHFFEHLMFKGTTKYPKNSFDLLLDENGAERNAFTGLETTFYYERAKVGLLEQLMDLEADRMQNLVLTPEVFETERKVVQEERRLRIESDPYGLAMERMSATLFKQHPYGRPIVGLAEDVAKLTLADAKAFYRAHYTPSNAILLVVGDVRPADVKRLAEKYYGPLQNVETQPVVPRTAEPRHQKPDRLELDDVRLAEASISRAYNIGLSVGITPRQAAAYAVLASIVGSNSQSRLNRQLVTRDQVATNIAASYGGSTDEYAMFYLYGSPRSGFDVIELEKRIDVILKDVVDHGVTAEELTDAINTAAAKDIYARDSATSIGAEAAEVLASGRQLAFIDDVSAALATLTPMDVQAAAQSVFVANQSVTLVMRPRR